MPQTSSANLGPSLAATSPGPRLPRPSGASPAKSRLTVRLPDLNAQRRAPSETVASPAAEAKTPLGGVGRPSPNDGKPAPDEGSPLPNDGKPAPNDGGVGRPTPNDAALTDLVLNQARAASQKVFDFVRQPKFWLACVVAIAVQFVLAFVMTPAEGDSDRAEHQRTAVKPRTKPTAPPAAQIIVPAAAAPTDVLDRSNAPVNGATTPMGLSVPLDSSSDAARAVAPPTRMAENRRLAAESGQLDRGPAAGPDGATLGGILPLEPSTGPNTNEQP